ncbi:MAG: hypothetical protein GXO78_08365 [Calditrichaeota bacterium]|nr:hypothetical protein [Calditrichota bacterium]
MEYSPKKDGIYALAIWSAPILLFFFLIFSYSQLILGIFILSVLLSFWMWNSTRYSIENGELFIKCWVLKKKVPVKDVVKVRRTRNYLASYALAVDRLEITEKNNQKFYVSPDNVEMFISELKKYNPNISIS